MRPLAAIGIAAVLAASLLLPGCASAPAAHSGAVPQTSAPPPAAPPEGMPPGAVSGMTTRPGDIQYDIRFAMTMPSSSQFNFRDRDLSFYFRPTSEVLNMQVQNLQDRPVWIDWDRSVFRDIVGRTYKVAHSTTRFSDRYGALAQTQIIGQQTYADYMLPMDYLLDPAGSDQQLHRPVVPVDSSSPQYTGLEFGVDLVFMVEEQPRNYSFRFKVASVIPHTR